MADELATQTMTAPTEAAGTPSPASASPDVPAASSGGSQVPEPTPAQPKAEPTPEKAPEKVDYRKRLQDDPELRSIVEQEADRLTQKRLAAERRKQDKAQLEKATDDPVAALEYAKARREEVEAEEATATRATATQQQAIGILSDYWEDPEWKDEYERLRGQKEAAERWQKDPVAGARWLVREVNKAIIAREVDKRVKETVPEVAKAQAAEMTNAALQKVAVPPGSGGGAATSDDAYLKAYARGEVDDHKRAREIMARLR